MISDISIMLDVMCMFKCDIQSIRVHRQHTLILSTSLTTQNQCSEYHNGLSYVVLL